MMGVAAQSLGEVSNLVTEDDAAPSIATERALQSSAQRPHRITPPARHRDQIRATAPANIMTSNHISNKKFNKQCR